MNPQDRGRDSTHAQPMPIHPACLAYPGSLLDLASPDLATAFHPLSQAIGNPAPLGLLAFGMTTGASLGVSDWDCGHASDWVEPKLV